MGLSDLEACGARLRAGDLVAFPTETVYGLGGHALSETACRKIFAAKERPLTDPLIVHVHDPLTALGLWASTRVNTIAEEETTTTQDTSTTQPSVPTNDDDSLEASILQYLCDAFWPGPLTIVARAARGQVPDVVMAGTGFVACRSPRHPVARALLQAAQVPIAAPSANKFGHVSPTTAQHVWDDLQHEASVWILDPDQQSVETANSCDSSNPAMDTVPPAPQQQQEQQQVGVESSVVKLEMVPPPDNDNHKNQLPVARLTMLRQGAISAGQLQDALHQHAATATTNNWTMDRIEVVAQTQAMLSQHVSAVSPGQTLRHYSPHVPSFLVSAQCQPSRNHDNDTDDSTLSAADQDILQTAVVIDYGQALGSWKSVALAYRDLSPSRSATQAAQSIYDTLRWAEQVPGAVRILFPMLTAKDDNDEDDEPTKALLGAVQDRLTRAASGKVVDQLNQAVLP